MTEGDPRRPGQYYRDAERKANRMKNRAGYKKRPVRFVVPDLERLVKGFSETYDMDMPEKRGTPLLLGVPVEQAELGVLEGDIRLETEPRQEVS